MEISIIIAIIAIGLIVHHLLKIKEERDERKKNEAKIKEEIFDEKPDTRELMLNTLTQLGCQPQVDEDGTINVQYQGENFIMECRGMYARLWDPLWAEIRADDPNLPNVREAINAANFCFGPTVVLTGPNKEGIMEFNSRYDIMLHPACPDNIPFVKASLDSFFETKNEVRSNIQLLNTRQKEAQSNRRPVGFMPNSTADTNE